MVGANGRERRRPFKPKCMSFIHFVRNVRSLTNELDKLVVLKRTPQISRSYVLLRHCCRNIRQTPLPYYLDLRLYAQTEIADRDVRLKEKGLKCLLMTTDGVILDMSLRRSVYSHQISNCWQWVSVHVVYWEKAVFGVITSFENKQQRHYSNAFVVIARGLNTIYLSNIPKVCQLICNLLYLFVQFFLSNSSCHNTISLWGLI